MTLLLLTGCLARTILFPGDDTGASGTPTPTGTPADDTGAADDTGTAPTDTGPDPLPGGPVLAIWGPGPGAHLGRTLAAADLDADGLPELALASARPGRVELLPTTSLWLVDLPATGTRVLAPGDPRAVVARADDGADLVLAALPEADARGDDGLVLTDGGLKSPARRLDGLPTLGPSAGAGTLRFTDPELWFLEDLAPVGDPDGNGVPDLGLVVRWWQTIGPTADARRGTADRSAALVVPATPGPRDLAFHDAFAHADGADPIAAVRGPGDLDGDGLDDLLLTGAALSFVPGPPGYGPVADVATWRLLRTEGAVAEPVGDVDGDGTADVALGRAVGEAGDIGAVWILPGPAPAVEALDELPLRADGDGPGSQLGRALAPAGDLDGDGVGEVWAGTDGDGARLLGVADGALGERARVTVAGAAPGAVLLGGLDLTGDGVPDLGMSDPDADREGARAAGVVWVWSGADYSR